MLIAQEIKDKLRATMDRESGKVVANAAGVSRQALYNVLDDMAGEQTIRKLKPILYNMDNKNQS